MRINIGRDNVNSQEQKILLNQVRHRILQFILRKGNATAREIGAELSDVPQASLYRQIKTLSDGGFIEVSGQKRIRGTLECTYTLSKALLKEDENGRSELNIQFMLLSIAQDFDDYQSKDKDRELLDFISAPVYMSDAEYREYVEEINRITRKYIDKGLDSGRRGRRVTFVSSPA